MEKKKKITIFCFLILLLVIVILILFLIFNKKDESIDELFINEDSIYDSENNGFKDKDDQNISKEDINYDNIQIVDNDNNSSYITYSDEQDVIDYLSNIEREVSTSSVKDKFKQYFILVVDFIFYDGEIKGYTFNELSESAKLKVIAIALKIDSKIEEKIPNYKENISSVGSSVYTDIKERLVTLYMDISMNVCQNSESECDKAKEIFSEIKSVCKIGWSFVKNLISSGVSKLENWYDIYSGK